MPSVDEKLLANKSNSADRAGDFRQAKHWLKNESENDISFKDTKDFIKDPRAYINDDLEEANQKLLRASFFNQARQRAKKRKKESIDNKKDGIINQGKVVLAGILRWCWLPGLKISFGLTLIWINIHWFLSNIFSSLFCKLGEEWFLRPGVQGDPVKRKIVKQSGKKINLVETMGCACLNILVIFIILGALIIFFWPIAVVMAIIDIGHAILESLGLIKELK